MKTVFLFFNRLRQYFLKNRLLFLLFVIGGVVNVVMVTYCYGNLLPMISERNSQDWIRRQYSVLFGDEAPDWEKVKEFAQNPLIAACEYETAGQFKTCDPDYPMIKMSGTLEFTGPYQVIAPHSGKRVVGDTLEFCGKTFEVIGTSSTGGGYIPYETFVELGCADQITAIRLFSAERQDPMDDQVLKLLEKTFPESTYIGGDALGYAYDDVVLTKFMFVFVAINAFLVNLSYIFLLRYIVDSQKTENIISMISGASRGRLTVYIFWETVIMALAANGLGLLLHWLLYEPVFAQLNIYPDIVYTSGDYFMIYLLMVVLSLVVTIPFVMKYLKLSPVAARREHDM